MRLRMFLAALVVLSATALVAQTFRGTILGTVTDHRVRSFPAPR